MNEEEESRRRDMTRPFYASFYHVAHLHHDSLLEVPGMVYINALSLAMFRYPEATEDGE